MRCTTAACLLLLLAACLVPFADDSDGKEQIAAESMTYSDGIFTIVLTEPVDGTFECYVTGPGGGYVMQPSPAKISDDRVLLGCDPDARIVDGTYTAVLDGTEYLITASAVLEGMASSVTLDRDEVAMEPGESMRLGYTVAPDTAAGTPVRWSSSDPDVASVGPDGSVKAHKTGVTTVMIVTDNGFSDTCRITVEERQVPPTPQAPVLMSLETSGTPVTVYETGDRFDIGTMKVTAVYSDGTTRDVTSLCTVSPESFGTPGDADVSLSYGGKSVTVKVSVLEPGPFEPVVELDGGVLGKDACDAILEDLAHSSDDSPSVTLRSEKTDSVRFPCVLADALSSPGSSLTAVLSKGTIVLPGEALASLDGSEACVSVSEAPWFMNLSGTSVLGAYSVSVSVDGKEISHLPCPMAVSLDLGIPGGTVHSDVEVVRMNADGGKHPVGGAVFSEGRVSFETDVPSVYVLQTAQPETPGIPSEPDEPSENDGDADGPSAVLYAAIAVLLITIIAATAFIKHSR